MIVRGGVRKYVLVMVLYNSTYGWGGGSTVFVLVKCNGSLPRHNSTVCIAIHPMTTLHINSHIYLLCECEKTVAPFPRSIRWIRLPKNHNTRFCNGFVAYGKMS